jgi:hypothetical protein
MIRSLVRALVPSALLVRLVVCQTVLVEDFVYPAGDSLTAHGWINSQSTTTNAILVRSPGLTFPGYAGSGIGNAVSLTSSGQDLHREFPPDSTGSFFASFILRITEAKSGDYFAHFHTNPVSTNFVARTFVRKAANGLLAFGIAKKGTNTTPTHVYSDSVYHTDSTYVLVLKYTFYPGSTTDDAASLFVFGRVDIPPTEPVAPTVGPVVDDTKDAAAIGAIALRQGEASKGPSLILDGIRVTRRWDAALPITLGSFAAERLPGTNSVRLDWTTLTEVDNYGFNVQRRGNAEETFTTIPGSFAPGQGTTTVPWHYTYVDSGVPEGVWAYRLEQIGLDGTTRHSEEVVVDMTTAVAEPLPGRNVLLQNYPNPFNPTTTISFTASQSSPAIVDVIDLNGQVVGTLFDGMIMKGRTYEVMFMGKDNASGVYVCRVRTAGTATIRKMVLVR